MLGRLSIPRSPTRDPARPRTLAPFRQPKHLAQAQPQRVIHGLVWGRVD
jgi:hypothetical protein